MKSNKLKMLDFEIKRIENLLAEQETLHRKKIFSDSDVTLIFPVFNCKDFQISQITYSNFVYIFEILYDTMQNNDNYNRIVQKLKANDIFTLSTDDASLIHNAGKLSEALIRFYHGLIRLQIFYAKQHYIYTSIINLDLFELQKEGYIAALNRYNHEYSKLCISILNNEKAGKFINDFTVFEVSNSRTVKHIKSSILSSSFTIYFELMRTNN
ncbi:MAG: hypothetical protein Q7J06_04460 [Bacteroidales bacterium]|nr:hypothetical protein [Bacteroidales bacterium]